MAKHNREYTELKGKSIQKTFFTSKVELSEAIEQIFGIPTTISSKALKG
jgi:hypothetical protein